MRARAPISILRHSNWDALLVALTLGYIVVLLLAPSILLIGVGVWWISNTVAHNFIHLPFFRSRAANRFFSGYLTLVSGIPQRLWRDRHLAHHADTKWRFRWSGQLVLEISLVLSLWAVLLQVAPQFFIKTYVPGYVLGLALCQIHGFYEHAHGTTSHYGWLYNVFFFNDGFHAEHHARPGLHWSRLPACAPPQAQRVSRWPAVLRWLELFSLTGLERLVLRWSWLRVFVMQSHTRAWRKILREMPVPGNVLIVGGGLFPRTALILRELLPQAKLTILDHNAEHLAVARRWLDESATYERAFYDVGQRPQPEPDLLVLPLSLRGNRYEAYKNPPVAYVAIHDWIWARRLPGAVVSLLLLKRLNLVKR